MFEKNEGTVVDHSLSIVSDKERSISGLARLRRVQLHNVKTFLLVESIFFYVAKTKAQSVFQSSIKVNVVILLLLAPAQSLLKHF